MSAIVKLYTRVATWLQAQDGWHYYYAHAIIAVALQLFLFWLTRDLRLATAIPFAVYVSRKETEWEKDTDPNNRWDKLGLIWPTVAMLGIAMVVGIVHVALSTWSPQ